jgi:hypothetical protein
MRRSLDRRVALGALVVVAVGIGVLVTTTRDDPAAPRSATTTSLEPTDPAALRELLALATERERATWLVDFAFERRLADGRSLRQRTTEANRPPLHVTATPSTVTVDFGDHVTSCTTTEDGPRCVDETDAREVGPAAVYRIVSARGAYTVHRAEDRTIVGERARCFVLTARGRALRELGDVNEQCYAADGVPLRAEIRRNGSVDTRVAQRVERRVSDTRIEALLGRLEEAEAEAEAEVSGEGGAG